MTSKMPTAFGATETAEQLGVRLFELPPTRFDPIKASAEELSQYGYPRRPDRGRHPDLYAAWNERVSAIRTSVRPQFASASYFVRATLIEEPPDPGPFTSLNWAGSMAMFGGDVIVSIDGSWTVPYLFNVSGAKILNTWLGIAGGSTHALRAGVLQAFGPGGFAATYPWWLSPVGAGVITNLPVAPGDVMYCSVGLPEDDADEIVFRFICRDLHMAFSMPPPSPFNGQSAEWILELPADLEFEEDGHYMPFELATFTSMFFYGVKGEGAVAAGGESMCPGMGVPITMVDVEGTPTCTPIAEGLMALRIKMDYGVQGGGPE
jgi:Peptidase A4 family